MKVPVLLADIRKWVNDALENGRHPLCGNNPEIRNDGTGYYLQPSKYLRVGYPCVAISDYGGAPLLDNGYFEFERDAKDWLEEQLKVDLEMTDVRMYVGNYIADDDLPACFMVNATKTATHVMLCLSYASKELMLSPFLLDQFSEDHKAEIYVGDPASASQWIILPIADELSEYAVWHIWKRQLEEEAADAQRQVHGSYSKAKEYLAQISSRFEKLHQRTDSGVSYSPIPDDPYHCEIHTASCNGETKVKVYDPTQKESLRELVSAIILAENTSRPLSDFYGQEVA